MKKLIPFCLLLCFTSTAGAQNWPQFRGANASGVAEGRKTPLSWDATKAQGVVWKTPIQTGMDGMRGCWVLGLRRLGSPV